jgi:putative transposase
LAKARCNYHHLFKDEMHMTIARSQQVSLEHTPYYHCTSRCVRRAFLCGLDRHSGKNFEHRRQWIENRLKFLVQVFAIDLLAYAIMSNHYHVVIRINLPEATVWSDKEVIERWGQIYCVPDGEVSEQRIGIWRARLADISWFMRCINEKLARVANLEDSCKGRFWEGRFKSQALLDESALLRCMAYVDLNPIRAKIATAPESSHYTSIKSRIDGTDKHLLPLDCRESGVRSPIPVGQIEYLQLVDWTGRALMLNKRGAIPQSFPPILQRLGWEPDQWSRELQQFGHWYYRAVGASQALSRYCEHLGQQWLKGSGGRMRLNSRELLT